MGNWIVEKIISDPSKVALILVADETYRNGSPVQLVLQCMDGAIQAFIQWGQGKISHGSTFPVRFKFGEEEPQESNWHIDVSQVSIHYPDGAKDFISKLTQVNTFQAEIYESDGPPCRAYFSVTGLDRHLNELWSAYEHGK